MGAWTGRFRAAAAACCAAAAVLLVAGLIGGATLNSSPSAGVTTLRGLAQLKPSTPHGFAAYARAQALFSGANLVTALLLVIALLLVTVAAAESSDTGPVDEQLMRRAVFVIGVLVALGALALTGVTIWYWRIRGNLFSSGQLAQRVGAALAAAIVAIAAAWWATAGPASEPT